MSFSAYAAFVILGMTVLTFGFFRLGGYLAGGLLPQTGRLAHVLGRLPAFVLIAVVAPSVVQLGVWGFMAAGLVLLVTHLSGRALLAMVLSVGLIAALRAVELLAMP